MYMDSLVRLHHINPERFTLPVIPSSITRHLQIIAVDLLTLGYFAHGHGDATRRLVTSKEHILHRAPWMWKLHV